jgi:hypothetical protein
MPDVEREALLRRFGRWCGEQRLTVNFTATNRAKSPDDPRPKQMIIQGWQHTPSLASGDHGEAAFGRGVTCNPALVLGASVIGIECDSEEDLAAVEALGLPATITVCSSAPFKRHWWWRPPAELETVPFVAFRFEHGRVSADTERYLLIPPSIHPSGAVYSFLPGLGPGEVEIAEMPVAVYSECVRRWRNGKREQRDRFRVDPDAKVGFGHRHDAVFRFACALRRWTASEDEILQMALVYNREHCDPPMEGARVRSQVRGAMKMADRSPDPDEVELRGKADEFLQEFLSGSVKPTDGSTATRRRLAAPLIVSLVEFLGGGEDDAAWLVDHLAARGALVVVAGLPKVGKSTFVYGMLGALTND